MRETAAQSAAQLGERVHSAEIAFFGGRFTAVPRDYMVSLLEAAHESVKEFGFAGIRCSTRPDAVGEEVLYLLKKYGVTAVELGAQSMDDEVLSLNRRGHTSGQTEAAAQRVKAFGFQLGLQMMTGLYGDTDGRALETAERMIALKPSTVRIYPTVVLQGTYLAELYARGEYTPQTLEEAVTLCALLLPLFEDAGIKVIRMGLHAQTAVEAQKLAGPYHPAFRELVQSRVFLEKLLSCLEKPGRYVVRVHPQSISVALGQGKKNREILRQEGLLVTFLQDEAVPRGLFSVDGSGNSV